MIVLNKSITSKIYHLNCELKLKKPINIILLWELCSIPNSKVIYLDLYNDEKMNVSIAQYRCSQLNDDFESFKIDCICSNIGIINPLYWDLCLEINNCDVNLCYEPNFDNIITMYMDGTEKDINEIINTIKKIDDNYNKAKIMNNIYENCNSAIEACNIAEKNNDNRTQSEILEDKIKNIDCTEITVNKNIIKEILLNEKEC